jgi:hypothetical protein
MSKYLVCLNRCTYSGIIRSVGGSLPISLRSQQPHHHHGRRRKCPPKALHDNKMSLTRKRRRPLRLHWAVVLMPLPSPQVETGRRTQHRRCPPRLPCSFFLHDFAPPPLSFARGPVKGGGVASPPSFDSTLSSSLSLSSSSFRALQYYVVAIATSLDSPSSLSRCAVASIAKPPPLLPRQCLSNCDSLAPAVGCCIVTSLAAPVPLFLCRRLSCCSATLLLRRRLSPCGASLAPAGCRFANYLDVPPSLVPRRMVVALLTTSLFVRHSLSLRHLSHCTTVSLGHRPSQPQ